MGVMYCRVAAGQAGRVGQAHARRGAAIEESKGEAPRGSERKTFLHVCALMLLVVRLYFFLCSIFDFDI